MGLEAYYHLGKRSCTGAGYLLCEGDPRTGQPLNMSDRLPYIQTAKLRHGTCTPEVRLNFQECMPGLHLNIFIARLAPMAGTIKNATKKMLT